MNLYDIRNSYLPEKIKRRKIARLIRKEGYNFIDSQLVAKTYNGDLDLSQLKKRIEEREENKNIIFPFYVTEFDNSSFHEYITTEIYTKNRFSNSSVLITGENELKDFYNKQNIRASEVYQRSREY